MKNSETAIALVNILIFTVIFVVLAGVLLSLLSSHTRYLESGVRRIKAQYATEAASVASLDALRRGAALSNVNVEWTYDMSGNPSAYKTIVITSAAGAGIGGTTVVNGRGDYTYSW